MFLPCLNIVSADGIPIVKIEVHSTLRENRQLAFIEVNDNSEKINLFLSVSSLTPDENFTIVIPLRTKPIGINAEKMTDKKFIENYEFDKLIELSKRNGLGKIGSDFKEFAPFFIASEIFGLLPATSFYFWAFSYVGTASAERHKFDGLTIDINSFNSTDSLKQFYNSLNITVPKDVNETISKYSEYYIAVINTTTKPPIPKEEFDFLKTKCPEGFKEFEKYVRENPNPTFKIPEEDWYFDSFSSYFNEEIQAIHSKMLTECRSEKVSEYFGNLIFATYGIENVEGYSLSFEIPLFNGNAYFPLGTSSSWNANPEIIVIFETDKEIELKNANEVFYNGKHYFIYEFNNEKPNYDLEGKVKDRDFNTNMKEFSYNTNIFLYEKSLFFASLVWLFIFILFWLILLIFIDTLLIDIFSKKKLSKKRVFKLLILSFVATFICLLATVVVGSLVLYYLYRRKDMAEEKNRK